MNQTKAEPLPRRGRPINANARAARVRHILDAARICFIRKGFHAASTADISAAAGISVASLYQSFPSKDDLIVAMAENDLQTHLQAITAMGEATTLREGLRLVLTLLASEPDALESSRLRLEILAEATRNVRVRDAVSQAEAIMVAAVATVLERARERGELEPAVDPVRAATLLLCLADGFFARLSVMASDGMDVVDDFSEMAIAALQSCHRRGFSGRG
jgi:TetR/AcrR family transcriptional repressor of uid operon